jgi:hypothetical protein
MAMAAGISGRSLTVKKISPDFGSREHNRRRRAGGGRLESTIAIVGLV